VELEQLVDIELGCLEDFRLSDIDVLEGVDAAGSLLDLLADGFRHELLNQLLQVTARGLPGHDLEHLLAEFPDLGGLGVGGLLHLRGAAPGEADSEETEEVAIGGLDVNVGLDESLPLADEGTELVGGEVHSVEVGEAVLALDLVDAELDLAEVLLLILVEISEGDLDNATLERVVGVPCSDESAPIRVSIGAFRRTHALGSIGEGLADIADLED
jgi:hypothetical protein